MNDITTCQICGRAIKSAKGLIAHHGYQRPGHGWQTGSCYGARHLPFEVSRDTLGLWIESVTAELESVTQRRSDIDNEEAPATFTYTRRRGISRYGEDRETITVQVTRATFEVEAKDGEHAQAFRQWGMYTFDKVKEQHVRVLDGRITALRHELEHQEKRYAAWKPAA